MFLPRIVTWVAIVVIPTALYLYLDHVRNDVAFTTRSLVKQVRKAEEVAQAEIRSAEVGSGDEAMDRLLRASERLERVHTRLFLKFHHPERNPDEQMQRFESLWRALRDADPETVRYAEKQPKEDPGSHKRVVLGDEATRLSIDWVRYRGNWYVDSFHDREDDETAAAD